MAQQSPLPQLSSSICSKPVWHFPSQNGAVPSQTQFEGDGDAVVVTVVLGSNEITVVVTGVATAAVVASH